VVVMGEPYVGIVHPCKIYNVLALRKPFLYIGPNESHVTDIIGQSNYYVSAHGDVNGVVANILRAMRNPVPGSCLGVEVETLFSKDRLVPQMIGAIEQGDGHSSSRASRCAA
jgi:colanic acid biosynthesis glycosyl transferase WcaI